MSFDWKWAIPTGIATIGLLVAATGTVYQIRQYNHSAPKPDRAATGLTMIKIGLINLTFVIATWAAVLAEYFLMPASPSLFAT